MKTIKVSEATGPALAWMVAKCQGYVEQGVYGTPEFRDSEVYLCYCDAVLNSCYSPATDWAQAGPIIQREGISIRLNHKQAQLWEAYIWLPTQHDQSEADSNSYTAFGMTPLIAAMRCFCSKLGDVVDIPEELCQQQSN